MKASSVQFAVFRGALGAFLVAHFTALLPYAKELYSPGGMYSLDFQSPFPSVFRVLQSEAEITGFFAGLSIVAALFAAGFHRRVLAIVLWLGWASLTNRLPFLYIPSEGLVGWLLLFSAVVPSGESWSIRPGAKSGWSLAPVSLFSVWVVLGVGYLASGIDKLDSPSWQQGTAIRSVLTSPIARWHSLAQIADRIPLYLVQAMSWGVVAVEICFVALIWHRWTRPIAWLSMSGMHLGIRLVLDLHTISDPFLIAHLLIFDPRWVSNVTRQWRTRTSR